MEKTSDQYLPVPTDDLSRTFTLSRPNEDQTLPHIGVVGDTYTISVPGAATANRFCVIDMHIPPGGGPPPHRHNFEETFVLLEGEMEATFRSQKVTVRAGETLHVPANAPHQFKNTSAQPVRLLCICSPAGQENFFAEIGTPLPTRTTPPPPESEEQREAFMKKARQLAPKYATELLKQA